MSRRKQKNWKRSSSSRQKKSSSQEKKFQPTPTPSTHQGNSSVPKKKTQLTAAPSISASPTKRPALAASPTSVTPSISAKDFFREVWSVFIEHEIMHFSSIFFGILIGIILTFLYNEYILSSIIPDFSSTHPSIYPLIKGFCSIILSSISLLFSIFIYSAYLVVLSWRSFALCAEGASLWHYESPVDTEHRKDLEDFIRRESSSVTHLCIIGATGVDTFVDRTSPFYEAVKNASHVEVILANPDKESHFIKDRVRKLALCDKNINLQSYISDINKSINYLKTIATRDKTVEIYTYSSDIQWKIIIFGEYLLLQHYGDKHVRDTPIYLFAKSNRQPARGLHKAMLCEYGITKASSKRV